MPVKLRMTCIIFSSAFNNQNADGTYGVLISYCKLGLHAYSISFYSCKIRTLMTLFYLDVCIT